MNKSQYHRDWPAISRQIREQAGDVCEHCGAPNHTWIQRNVAGEWMRDDELQHTNSTEAWSWLGTWNPPPPAYIVLTVADLCHCDKRICTDPTHMVCLCQKCHFALDRAENTRKAGETRRHKKAAATAATGQLAL